MSSNLNSLRFNPLNYSETYFELDSEEATHCHYSHLICCVYIKGLRHVLRQLIQRMKAMLLCIVCLSIQRSKLAMHLSWDDKNQLKLIGKTDRLQISLQNAYFIVLANFMYFSYISDRNLIILYKFT